MCRSGYAERQHAASLDTGGCSNSITQSMDRSLGWRDQRRLGLVIHFELTLTRQVRRWSSMAEETWFGIGGQVRWLQLLRALRY